VEDEVEDLAQRCHFSDGQLPLQLQHVDAQLPGQDPGSLLLDRLELGDDGRALS
jgi:hypothetical protein